MRPLAILALLFSCIAAGADEWRPFTANPDYEVYGHMERGVFRYSQTRRKETTKNFGLTLPTKEQAFEANDFEVTGTDKDLGRAIATAALETESTKTEAPKAEPIVAKESAAGDDCRNRPCPKPDPLPKIPGRVAWETGDIILVCLAGLFGLCFAFLIIAIKLILLFLVCRWLYRKLTAPPAPTP